MKKGGKSNSKGQTLGRALEKARNKAKTQPAQSRHTIVSFMKCFHQKVEIFDI
jgi:hypothetical protein